MTKLFPKTFRVASEFSLPEAVAHHESRRSTGTTVLLSDRATRKRRNTQEVEGICCYDCAVWQDAYRLTILVEEPTYMSITNHVFKDMILFPEHLKFGG